MLNLMEQDTIAHVKLQWPDSGILTQELLSDFIKLMDYLEDETACTLIVFQGLDTQQPIAQSVAPDIEHCRKWENILRRIERFTGASIVGIDGFCTRFHFQLALACDYKVATTRSIFQAPEVKEGFLPGMLAFRLAKYIGVGAARRLLFIGEPCATAEAIHLGMIEHQCEVADFEQVISETQQALMPIDPEVLLNTRRLLNESFATSYEDAIGHFLAAQNLCLAKTAK